MKHQALACPFEGHVEHLVHRLSELSKNAIAIDEKA
jgi:hypothetical protein